MLEARWISYKYANTPNGRHAVSELSIELVPGRFYAIVGPNGCGKSTLLDLLCGHKRPGSGTVTCNGRPLTEYGKKALARNIALVPQESSLNFPYTAREVVIMGRYPHLGRFAAPDAVDLAFVDQVLAECHALPLAGRYMTELSGGEKQRVVFARAMAQDTPVLLLDEPCANLDVRHALLLLDLAAAQVRRNNRVVAAVMHDINLAARYADHLVFMKNGRIEAAGPTREVLDREILKKIFGVEAKLAMEPAINAPQVVFLR